MVAFRRAVLPSGIRGPRSTAHATHEYHGHPSQKLEGGWAAAWALPSAQFAKGKDPNSSHQCSQPFIVAVPSPRTTSQGSGGRKLPLPRSVMHGHTQGVAYGKKPLPPHSPAPSTLCHCGALP